MTPEERQIRRELAALREHMAARMAAGSPAGAVRDAIVAQARIIERERAMRGAHEALEGLGK